MKTTILLPPIPPQAPTQSFLRCVATTNQERDDAWRRYSDEKLRWACGLLDFEHNEREAQRAVLHARAQARLRRRG